MFNSFKKIKSIISSIVFVLFLLLPLSTVLAMAIIPSPPVPPIIPVIPLEVKYAPNLWFDSEEEYYPTSPFFDGNEDLSGEDNKINYEALKNLENKLDRFTVYYHIVGMPAETVYQYFFYYAYNKMPKMNEHYHDWEGVFVFVDNDTEKVNRVVASAHGNWRPHNEYFNPQLEDDEHIGILIEQGSHANCVDRNNNGLFERNIDITNGWIIPGLIKYGYGISKSLWTIEDQQNGYRIYAEHPKYSFNLIPITDFFIDKFGKDENGEQLKTFPESPVKGLCVKIPSFFGLQPCIPIGGNPPEHPWHNEAYNEPYKIIPKLSNYIHGTINPLFIPGLSSPAMGIILIMSEEPYPFTFTDENGEFLINNIPEGEHNIIVNLENYAPYKQRFIIEENESEENEIIVGVDGILNLIPENEAFKLKGTIKDSEGNIIVNSEINVYDKNGNKLFTTLTDEEGHYLFYLSSENTYTVEVIKEDEIEISGNIKSKPGKELIANLSIENPKLLKIQSIEKLEQLKILPLNLPLANGEKERIFFFKKGERERVNRKIDQIIKSIQLGLNENLWIDDTHLKEKDFQGRKVFLSDLTAVAKIKNYSRVIKKFRKKNKIPENLFETFDEVSNNLAKADYLLSETILNEAKQELENLETNRLKKNQKKALKIIKKRIQKAEQYLEKAEKQKMKKNYRRSVYYSLRTWNSVVFTKRWLNMTAAQFYAR